ncbi:enoyl-CoA hydratase [Stappia sp. ES.058]|uniref:enoyl-CoA hydratase n=1 Tax=Stappia sp. ES.058 TaxID=1881061 RepID=UPI00087DE70E|nr:enoyl-CoA hydratase [Stappia sp. ES.058]SDU22121.1 Enoyl-CoA hydratase/carnithine racemase [Stappia sp. ES.058]
MTHDSTVAGPDMSTDRPRIETHVDGATGWLVIHNPARRNAVTLGMWRALPGALTSLAATPGLRCVILRGAGDATFVAGADISEFATLRKDAASARAYEAANAAAFDALRDCALPSVAMIRGFCLGGGLGLAAACDLRIADETAQFGIPAARLGVGYPPSAIADIVRLVGPSRAKLMFYTARRLDCGQAQAAGLIDLAVGDDDLEAATRELATTISNGAPLTLAAAKAGVDAVAGKMSPEELEACQALADACFDSADFAEGRSAFLEKRTPAFTGK